VAEIVEIIRKGDLEKAGEQLFSETGRRMGNPQSNQPSKPDDYSFMLFRRKK
jgi:hypothetical protein